MKFLKNKSPWQLKKRQILPAMTLLIVGLLLTLAATLLVKTGVEQKAETEFNFACSELKNKIASRLHAHAQLLRSQSVLFAVNEELTRSDWRNAYLNQMIEKNLPGIQGIGYSVIIHQNQLAQHEKKIRSEGFPKYSVKPKGPREHYTSIIYLEPFSGRNLRAFGYDMFSEPVRRAAMEKARDLNIASLSGKITLVQESNTDIQAGTLMYVPVFKKGMPIGTIEERRRAILGWVYSPYRMNDLMDGILGGYQSINGKNFRLEIYDNTSYNKDALLYDSRRSIGNDSMSSSSAITLKTSIIFNDHYWYLQYTQYDLPASASDYNKAWYTATGGVSISILLFVLYMSLITTNIRAHKLAEELTKELSQSEAKYSAIFKNEIYAISIFDQETSKFLDVNDRHCSMYGYSKEEFLSGMTIYNVSAEISLSTSSTKQAASEGTVFMPLRYHKKKDGTIFPVEIVGGPYIWKSKKVIFALARDISERKKAEEALLESEKKFNKTFHSSPVAMSLSTIKEGLIIDINSEFLRYSERTREEVIEHTGYDLKLWAHPEQRNELSQILRQYGSVRNVVMELQTKSGRIKQVLASAEVVIIGEDDCIILSMQDITERRQIENQIKENENLQRSLLENIAVGIMIIDPATRVIERINKFALSLIQETEENIIGRRCHLFICPAQEQCCPVCNNNHDINNSEKILLRADKTQIAILKTVKRIKIGGEEKLLESFVDMTIQKEAEEALQQSNQKWEAIISASPDGIGIISLDGKNQLISDKLAKMHGYSVEEKRELLGKSFYDFIDSSNCSLAIENINGLLTGNRDQKIAEYLSLKKDGSKFYVDVNSTALLDLNRNPSSILFIERDITERKKGEEALKQITNRLSLATHAGGVGIWDFNIIENSLIWDDQMYSLYGIEDSSHDNAYNLWQKGLHPDDMPRIEEETENAILGKKNFDTEFRIVWPDGSIHNIRALAIVQRDSTGKPTNMIGTNWDVTAQKRTETELKNLLEELIYTKSVLEERADELARVNSDLVESRIKADAANIAKSMFIANVSHEIRTPMNAILGFSEILLKRITEETAHGYLKTIFSSGKSLLHLINDILDLSKIEAGKMELEPVQVNLKNLINDIVSLFKYKAAEREIDLLIDYTSDFPQTIIADEIRIRQVLVNIVGNAFKFTNKGYVKIIVAVNKYYGEENCLDFSITIEDTGVGIAEDDQKRVFESFSQAHQKAVNNSSGTGLGLAISNRLAELMGGNITLESKLNEGSRFILNLKKIKYSDTETALQNDYEIQTDNVLFEKRIILIIDDVPQNINLIKGFLIDQPFEIIEGYNGKEAIEFANKFKPDLILMDIRMPEMDGITAAGLLKNDPATKSIPMIAFTASLPSEKDNDALHIFNDSLYKPIFRNKLYVSLMKFIPYTVSDSSEEVKSTNIQDEFLNLTNAEKVTLKVQLDNLESAFNNKSKELYDIFDSDEIDAFVENLDKYVNANNIPLFDKYISELKSAINCFDIETIQKLLSQFGANIQNIKKLLNAE
jgi:PAS domain S-box-containing protein